MVDLEMSVSIAKQSIITDVQMNCSIHETTTEQKKTLKQY